MKQWIDRFFDMLEEHGWQGRIVPIAHLADLQRAICDNFEYGLIDPTLYREQLGFISYDPPADLPGARSIIIVAVPTPQMRIFFDWRAERVPVIIARRLPPVPAAVTVKDAGCPQRISAVWS